MTIASLVLAGGGAPEWATDAWQDWAAHVVASEARDVPSADLVVACTMVRDIERGWPPWALDRRWFGYGPPDEADYAAVRQAVNGGCGDVPHYKFVGNFQDAQLWRMNDYFDGRADLYLGKYGSAVVGVPADEQPVEIPKLPRLPNGVEMR